MDKTKLRAVTEALRSFFDVPETFRFQGQTFEERCEAWARHALDQLEEELESAEVRFRNFYRCPSLWSRVGGRVGLHVRRPMSPLSPEEHQPLSLRRRSRQLTPPRQRRNDTMPKSPDWKTPHVRQDHQQHRNPPVPSILSVRADTLRLPGTRKDVEGVPKSSRRRGVGQQDIRFSLPTHEADSDRGESSTGWTTGGSDLALL